MHILILFWIKLNQEQNTTPWAWHCWTPSLVVSCKTWFMGSCVIIQPRRNSGFASITNNVQCCELNVSWFKITREVACVCVLDKYETRGECYVKPREVWIESENQHQDPVAWMLWAMLKAITGQYSSYPGISLHNTEICGPSWSALSPQIFRYQLKKFVQSEQSFGSNWPIRAKHGTGLYSSGGNDHFMVLHSKRRCGKDILSNRKFFCKARPTLQHE